MRIVEPWELDEPDPERYCLGLDLGQVSDYTAIAVGRYNAERKARVVDVVYLERIGLGTSYPDVVEYVESLLLRPPLAGRCDLVVDATGVGRPVVDLFRERRLNPVALTITGGFDVTHEGRDWKVPKRELVAVVQVGLQARTLRVARDLAHAETLRGELAAFEIRVTAAANDTYGAWREGTHDDLVLAVAMVAWWARRAPGPLVVW